MVHRLAILFFIPLTMGIFLTSCNEPKVNEHTKSQNEISEKKVKDLFIKANQQVVQKENDEMDYYVKSHKLPFVKTNSGIRYFVYKPSAKGDSIKESEEIKMNFTLSLLNGTECYSSKQEGPRTFIVGHENIESGIHKGVQFLKHGDKALFLIPSYLAHGLLGDFKKIPPQTPIIYDVEIF